MLDLFYILKWWLVIFLVGVTFLPITSRIFSSFIDRGYLFSKIIGLCIVSYAIYVLSSAHILKFIFPNIVFVWVLFTAIQLFLLRKSKLNLRSNLKILTTEELIFFLTLTLWAYIRGFSPDIHDLEKFMDFGFINSILRSEYFPPRDMWLSPFSINYYYFGHLITSVITKITGIPSFITFNLMLASIFAFTFTMSFSIGISLINNIKIFSLKKSIIFGLIFSYIVSFAGNLNTLYAFFTHYDSEYPKALWELALSLSNFPNSYWYPSATRFIYHTIHEFPLYSFVVSDLHGHVLDIPVVLTMIAVFLSIFLKKKNSLPLVILISFLLSIAYMTNAWDGLIYLGLSLIILFFINFLNLKGKLIKRLFDTGVQTIKPAAILFVMYFIFTLIFNKDFSPFASGIGLNCAPDFLIKLQKIGPFIFEKDFCQITPFWQLLILYGFFFFMLTSFILFLRKKILTTPDYFILIISLFSLLLIIAPEILYLKDIYTGHFRANTMFKLTYQAFIMLSIASSYILIRIFSQIKINKNKKYLTISYAVFIISALILLFFVSIYPYFAIPSGYGGLKKYSGLDGIKYIKEKKSSDYDAIIWINQNIKGQPVILEAQGDSYTDFARISANTGLPTVLGWTVHEWLWRGTYDIPSSRFDDIRALYETDEAYTAKKIINKYDISYIYIGGLEREKYKVSEMKFLELGNIVYAKGETNIYKIR